MSALITEEKPLFEEMGSNEFIFKEKVPAKRGTRTNMCKVEMDVVLRPYKDSKSWFYDITFKNSYKNKLKGGEELHPLYRYSVTEQDDCVFDGMCVVKNRITDNMVRALLSYRKDQLENIEGFDVGHRPTLDYCGEIMRAMIHLEA
mgnify:CR=1 FL=1